MTSYKHAVDKFMASDEWKIASDPSTLGKTPRVYLENRLRRAFDAGWKAKEAEDKASHERAIDMNFGN